MVIAATTLTPAAFSSPDDLQVVRGSNRAAGVHGRGDFYSRPGRGLGLHFSGSRRKIRSYGDGGMSGILTAGVRQDALRAAGPCQAHWRPAHGGFARRACPLPPDYRPMVAERIVPRGGDGVSQFAGGLVVDDGDAIHDARARR